MSVLKLNDQGDLDRGPEGVGYTRVKGIEEARVHLQTRMSLVRGEVKRNARVGVDIFWALEPDTPDAHVANHLASVMVGTPGVIDAVLQYNFEGETGVFSVQAQTTFETDDQRERRTEHETFLLQTSALVGGIGGPVDA